MAKSKIVCPQGHIARTGANYCYRCKSKLVEVEVEEFKSVRVSTKPLNVVAQCPHCFTDVAQGDNFCTGCSRDVSKLSRKD